VIPGYVLFRLANQTFALSLDQAREIVRLNGLERLPGTRPPMVGLILLRGNPLPVLDLRARGASDEEGDVLVMDIAGDPVGVAVDEVVAVVSADALPEAAEPAPKSLPSYVIGMHRNRGEPVLRVDLQGMLDVIAQGWTQSLASGGAGVLAS
jgi:chemotaxis signal transduction protein